MTKTIIAAVALIAAAAVPAHAVGVSSITTNGNTATVFNATPGSLSVDFGINNTAPISLGLVTETGDFGGIAFNSVVDSFLTVNLPGNPLKSFTLTLGGGATFGNLGTIAPAFSSATGVLSAGGTVYTIGFFPNEAFGFTLGNVGGGSDFVIDVSAIQPGSAFTLTLGSAAVPEPASWAMLIAGFGLVGAAMRRRTAALA